MKAVVGLVLLLLGASLFFLSFFSATRSETVIDISFGVAPDEKYGPYEDGTYHHTKVISKSTLAGEVVVEGESIRFLASGYNTRHLRNVVVGQSYSFDISPADDLYTFTFDNKESGTQSSVKFTLEEKWLNILLLIPGLFCLLTLVPVGLVLIIVSIQKKATR